MLAILATLEQQLPTLLRDDEPWQSLYIDYQLPIVERLWRQVGDYRLYLHRIHTCEPGAAFFHPHPWPSAMRVINGTYEMGMGFGPGLEAPPVSSTVVLQAGVAYEMTHPDAWHYVRPLDTASLSIMVSGKPWDRPVQPVTKKLSKLTPEQYTELLVCFSRVYI